MIKYKEPLSLAESLQFIKKSEERGNDLKVFVSKFSRINSEKAKELRKEIESLDIFKINEEKISKIIDLMPENVVDLNKIFIDLSLDENESKKILDVIKKYK